MISRVHGFTTTTTKRFLRPIDLCNNLAAYLNSKFRKVRAQRKGRLLLQRINVEAEYRFPSDWNQQEVRQKTYADLTKALGVWKDYLNEKKQRFM